jgi:hypothetical protein
MRYAEQTQIIISEDNSSAPQNVRFSDAITDVDTTSLAHLHDASDAYPVGTTSVPMGQITLAKYLWIKPAASIQIILSGSTTPLTLIAGKATKIWGNYTSLQIVVPTGTTNTLTPPQVSIVIGG